MRYSEGYCKAVFIGSLEPGTANSEGAGVGSSSPVWWYPIAEVMCAAFVSTRLQDRAGLIPSGDPA